MGRATGAGCPPFLHRLCPLAAMFSEPVPEPAKVLTIAGSNSGGAAGLQADLKTFTALEVYGMSVVAAVTAQNSREVVAVQWLPADFVAAQLEAVLSDYSPAVVKTGFLGRVDIVETVASILGAYRPAHLIVDPVLVNHRGEAMFPPTVTQAYLERLLPMAELVTPNREEAALLSGRPVADVEEMIAAARAIQHLGPAAALVKGGRLDEYVVDIFYDGWEVTQLMAPWVDSNNTHGSGDTLSAAICAYLAHGLSLAEAIGQAQSFTLEAIEKAAAWRLGRGHGPLCHW